MDIELASQMRDSLFDSKQSEALRLLYLESLTVIADRQTELLRFPPDMDADSGGVRMAGTIMQGLLHDAVNASLVFIREIVGSKLGRDGHIHARLSGNFAGLPPQSGNEAQIV